MKAHAETIPVVVTGIEPVTPLIKLFTLRSPDGSDLPAFSGGCHIVVVMPCEGRTYRNPYSLLSSPWDLSRCGHLIFCPPFLMPDSFAVTRIGTLSLVIGPLRLLRRQRAILGCLERL